MKKRRVPAVLGTMVLVPLFASAIFAQGSLSRKPAHDEITPSTAKQSRADACDAVLRRLDSLSQAPPNSEVDSRLTEIEHAIKDLKRSSMMSTLLPAGIAALAAIVGVFIGGLVNDRLQRARLVQEERVAGAKADLETRLAEARAKQERELAEKQAKLQIGNAVVEWQLKQLYLLYGPVRALLGQSFGLYRQMNAVLGNADSNRFRFIKVTNARGQNAEHGEEFQIRTPPQDWERFRTVMHIDQVYGLGFGVETYFDEIVSIGGRIVTIIEQNAGYARPDEEQLMTVFAKYLAHFAVLKHLQGLAKARLETARSQVKDSEKPLDSEGQLRVDVSAVFPVELHELIDQGFKAITKDIEQWRGRALA